MENTSGQGATAEVPAEIDRWNWGGFLLDWVWGIGNNTCRAFLVFVPFSHRPTAGGRTRGRIRRES